jgi:SAM-dependent methyltransferase
MAEVTEQQQDHQAYWDGRLAEDFSLGTTGFGGLGRGWNRWSYRLQRRVFLPIAKPLLKGRDPAKLRVLDVGSGVGFWIDRWRELGVRDITGSDITPTSAARLGEKYSEHRVVQLDIGGEDLSALEGRKFDLISVISVLYHIPEDANWERAYRNLHSLLDEGGLLITNDNFVEDGAFKTPDQAVRLGSEIEAVFERTGFELVTRRPMSVLMNNPVRSRNRLLRWWWAKLSAVLVRGERISAILGALIYPVELVLVRLVKRGPSSEMVVLRKKTSEA